ncbi:MAG: dihydrodipicolinate synthase family protein [Tannerella sp.]|jgi:4-hydroxy-tetrahydrodipicolinate synthase|nr:dihydrodipicolinate synthase family protein [Tannerella sp.]
MKIMTTFFDSKTPFRGIITPMITPLSDEKNLDTESLKSLVEHLVKGGVHGIFILGTTGEGISLSYKLKVELIELTVKFVKGRIPVFVSVTDNSLQDSVLLAEVSAENGVSALVAAPPFYFGLSQKELVYYYMKLADSVMLPLFLYNIPGQTKIMIDPETVKILASHPNITGIKDSSGNAPHFNTLLSVLKENESFSVLVGPDEMMASTVLMGGHGGVNSGSNLFPHLFTDLYQACLDRDMERVSVLQKKVMLLSTLIYQVGNSNVRFLKGLKYSLHLFGLCPDFLLPPLCHLEENEIVMLKENYLRLCEQLIC